MAFDALHLPLAALAAVLLDRLLGEPTRWHPLVGFGRLAARLEARLRRADSRAPHQCAAGVLAWLLAVLPLVLIAAAARAAAPAWAAWLIDVALLTFTLGAQSLGAHVRPIVEHLEAGHLDAARRAVGRVVSRDTAALDPEGIARAAVETTLENGSDAVFGALFWFAIGAGPAALLFRLANTLDALWGYRTARFRHFGWAAARLDDGLGYLPARLCALTYAALGQTRRALACWRTQAPAWDSPNAGPVMAAGGGSLGVQLGGAAMYHGQLEVRPPLGAGPAPAAADIRRALRLVDRGVILWLLAGFTLAVIGGAAHA